MKKIIAIPGLGGHESVYKHYASFFPEYAFESIEFIDIQRAERDLTTLLQGEDEIIVLANCYGAQPILRLIGKGQRIDKLIIIEPFFTELYWWKPLTVVANKILLFLSVLTDYLGLRRRHFTKENIDYTYLSRYPLWTQPMFDLMFQSTTDYLRKIDDIIHFRIPKQITIPTLLIFSPKGYSEDPERRQEIVNHFTNASVVEVTGRTHNIVTVSEHEIGEAIKNWLANT